ncbi:MAG: hypothetical protein GX564_04230 [Oligosphaeraceae bacterium]|nr:hypothetical protein [Oligosphaeraceae bacterium]
MNKSLLIFLLLGFVCVMSAEWDVSALRPGDVVQIRVFRVEEFSRSVRIGDDGSFTFPQCGSIEALGKSPKDIAAVLTERLSKLVATPHVDVFVESWGPRTVYILGEVNSSSMSLELPTFSRMTALQAISAAGGFTASADLTNVAVLRRNQDSQKLVRMPIDVSALVSKDSGGDEFILQPEDTLIVPKAPPVYVSGYVNSPGIYQIDTQQPPLCSELLVRVGGLSEEADVNDVRIVRRNAQGVRETIKVPLKDVRTGKYEADVVVLSGDYLIVGSAEKIFVLGEVNAPGPLTVPPGVTITASRAVVLAGGFTQIARERAVMLIRGQEISELNLRKFYQDPERQARDVELQNGDILFVPESFW